MSKVPKWLNSNIKRELQIIDVDSEVVSEEKKMKFPHVVNKTNMRNFIKYYMKTFNILTSVRMMGVMGDEKIALQCGQQFFSHPYVQKRVLRKLESLDPEELVTPAQVMAGLLESANNHHCPKSNATTRTNAWKEIGKLLGMYVDHTEVNVTSMPAVVNLKANKPKQLKQA